MDGKGGLSNNFSFNILSPFKNKSVNNVTNNSRDLSIVGLLNIFILFRKKSPLDSADLLTSKTGF